MIWSFVLAAVGILGIWLAGRKNIWGWAIGLFAQVLWVAYALVTVQYGFLLTAFGYGWVYATNWLRWRKESHGEPER
jgi:nicotinamide riboside transporter PnuC